MRRALIVACTVFALTTAPAAHAQVTIGSDLAAPPANPIAMEPAGLTAAQDGMTVPFSGVITRWRVGAGSITTPVRLRILRRGTPGSEVGRSDPETGPPAGWIAVYDTQISVATGDQIALDCCAGSMGGTFFVAEPAGSTDVWTPPIPDGAQIPDPPTQPDQPIGIAFNADLEPDGDGDGNGDHTQDPDDDNDRFDDGADVCANTPGVAPDGCPAPPATQPPPRVNTPAIVRFKTPFVGTEVGPSQLIELDVLDDFGTPTVTVFDDDGTVCTLRGAPYSCTWNPTGADVGRATLLASAVDADNRSSLASVRVRVARFKATLTRRVKGREVSGRLKLPAQVERALGCGGEVTVRRGKVRRTAKLKRNCTYSVRLPPGKGKPRARFGGNQVVAPT
jgi:Bacterial Ig domain